MERDPKKHKLKTPMKWLEKETLAIIIKTKKINSQ